MRKLLRQLLPITILVIAIGLFVVPAPAHAADGVVGTVVSLLTGGTDLFYGLIGKIFWWVLIPFAGFLLHLLGSVMDVALSYSMQPGLYNSAAIGMAWGIIRDLANMVFIFVLIFEGIRTILNIGNKASVQKTITSVIIAALFLNFSLFFTKVVIDTSNVAASWFIQGITNIGGDASSVSYSMVASLRMPNLTAASQTLSSNFSLESFTQGVLMFALICVAIYVFFNVVFLIIGRIVSFIFLLITAPIGFVGALVPQLKSYSEKWWKEINNQAFMLPMFFLMVYLTLFIVDRFDQLLSTTNTSSTGTGFEPINYVMFIIIIMMLLKALETAKEYSGEIGNKIGGLVKSATVFAGGVGLMSTAGKAAQTLANNAKFQKWSAEGGLVGKMTMKAVAGTASAGFGAKSGLADVTKAVGLSKAPLIKDAYKGTDKGYQGKIDQEKKDEEAYAKLLGKKGSAAGAENRAAYAQGLQGGIYQRYVKNSIGAAKSAAVLAKDAARTVGVGAALGAGIGGAQAGPIGAGIGAGIGAAATAGMAAGGGVKSMFEDKGRKAASKSIGEAAEKELKTAQKKEAGALAEKANAADALLVDSAKSEMTELLEKIEESTRNTDENIKKSMEDAEEAAKASMKTAKEIRDAEKTLKRTTMPVEQQTLREDIAIKRGMLEASATAQRNALRDIGAKNQALADDLAKLFERESFVREAGDRKEERKATIDAAREAAQQEARDLRMAADTKRLEDSPKAEKAPEEGKK